MSVTAILQARMSSSRLPGKVLMDVGGKPMLARQIDRLRRANGIQEIVVATSEEAGDDPLAETVTALGLPCFRGSLKDVLGRFCAASRRYPSEIVMRLTGDCPLTDPGLVDKLLQFHVDGGYDISALGAKHSFPHGLDCEVVKYDALQAAGREADDDYEREHVTPFLYRRPERFRIGSMTQERDDSSLRWTVDYPEDMALVRAIFEHFDEVKPDFTWIDVKEWLEGKPEIAALNASRAA